MKVIYHKNVSVYLNELVDVLYDKEYFGFKESAYDYVDWIFEQVESSIDRKLKKPAPKYFNRYGVGLSYVVYRKNSNRERILLIDNNPFAPVNQRVLGSSPRGRALKRIRVKYSILFLFCIYLKLRRY